MHLFEGEQRLRLIQNPQGVPFKILNLIVFPVKPELIKNHNIDSIIVNNIFRILIKKDL